MSLPDDQRYFAFALEIERHRQKLGIYGADPDALEKRFEAYLKRHNAIKDSSSKDKG